MMATTACVADSVPAMADAAAMAAVSVLPVAADSAADVQAAACLL